MIGRYHKILTPLDGSAFAEQVLPYLQHLAAPAETELILVTVVEPSQYAMASTRYTPPDMAQLIYEGGEAYLAEQRTKLQALGYQVKAYILHGSAASSILRVAQETKADLIAMTTHGRSGFVRWALGSVAEQVVRNTPLPVFLVREAMSAQRHQVRHILTPLDGSPLAEQALDEATGIAQATGAELLLIQVVQAMDEGSQRFWSQPVAEAEATFAELSTAAEDYLQKISRRLQAEGVNTTYRVLTGDVAQSILTAAEQKEIDLLIMSTHGRSGLNRWIYGSVANRVLRGVNCPLLLVHHPQAQTAV